MNYFFPILIFILLNSCTTKAQEYNTTPLHQANDTVVDDFFTKVMVDLLADDSVLVIFTNTKTNPTQDQTALLEMILKHQKEIYDEYLLSVFDYYKSARQDYANGVALAQSQNSEKLTSQDIEKILPTAHSKDYLKKFYNLVVLHLPEKVDWNEVEFVLEYDCNWDIENGLATRFRNWKAIETGTADIVSSLFLLEEK